MGQKETRDAKSTEMERMKDSIRKECQLERARLKVLALAKDVNGYWKLWSKTVERGWLKYVAEDRVYDKKATGRGKVELIHKKPKQAGADDKPKKTYLKGEEAREEIRAIRQARRCEQMAFRIVLAKKESTNLNTRATYRKLNGEAIAKLHKHQGKEDWEKELVEKSGTPTTGTQTSCWSRCSKMRL